MRGDLRGEKDLKMAGDEVTANSKKAKIRTPRTRQCLSRNNKKFSKKVLRLWDYAMNQNKEKKSIQPNQAPTVSPVPSVVHEEPPTIQAEEQPTGLRPTANSLSVSNTSMDAGDSDEEGQLQIPRPDTVPQRKASILHPSVHSKLSPNFIHHDHNDESVSAPPHLNKIREALEVAFLRKAEICRSIEEHLGAQIDFESDHYRKQQLVRKLKAKIAEKTEHIQRVKHNVSSLQKKMSAHADCISRITAAIDANRDNVLKSQESLNKWISNVCSQLLDMFLFQRCDTKYGREAWSGQDKQITYLMNHCKVTEGGIKAHIFSFSIHFAICKHPGNPAQLHIAYTNLTKNLCLTTKWTEDLIDTLMFKLNYCIIKLCIVRGVPGRSLSFLRPFSNIHELMAVLRMEKKVETTNNRAFDPKLRLQIMEEYQKVKWQETHAFTVDNVEEGGWVAVDFISNK
uniref:Uncharacterized protein n=1 Tax=Ditylenchus dipsaci TaxID=166011 RepID=A0A915DGS9_9BILA